MEDSKDVYSLREEGKENRNWGKNYGDGEEVINECVIAEVKAIEFDGKLDMSELQEASRATLIWQLFPR